MTSLNDVLLAMSNIPVDDPIAEIWGRGLQGGYKIIEYTGTLPITISANGDVLLDYRIYGASGGVGKPTDSGEPAGYKLPMKQHSANWFDKDSFDRADFYPLGYGLFNYITGLKPNTKYTLSATNTVTEYIWYGGSAAPDHRLPRTTTSDANGKIFFGISIDNFDYILQNDNIMVVEGSTPALYTPYSGAYTPVYIGENQLDSVNGVADYIDKANGKIVRMIGEYTFTGDESFNKYGSSDVFYTSKTIDPVGITTVNTITMRCNHPAFTAIENKDTRYWLNPEADDICCFLPGGRSQVFLRSTSNFTTATECKAYLKAQYDNGTPVKISYWLKTPIEEAPPVPLPEIPTIDGETIIDYDGDPKPSQMYAKYKDKE